MSDEHHHPDAPDADPGAPQEADTIVDVMALASAAGFTTDLRSLPDAAVHCAACDVASPATGWSADQYRRLEGASDAADLMIIVMAHCPNCQSGGVLVLGYGPNAGDEDAGVLEALDLRAAEAGTDPV